MKPICAEDTPRWHALLATPQRETAAEEWLARRGVYSFHPVTRHTITRRGVAVVRVTRYLPGYVFARFPGAAIWHEVFAAPCIRDAIRLASGTPAILRPADLQAIHAMRDRDQQARQNTRQAAAIRRGDRARILGVMEGVGAGEVVEIGTGKTKVRLTLFGAERDVEVSADTVLAKDA